MRCRLMDSERKSPFRCASCRRGSFDDVRLTSSRLNYRDDEVDDVEPAVRQSYSQDGGEQLLDERRAEGGTRMDDDDNFSIASEESGAISDGGQFELTISFLESDPVGAADVNNGRHAAGRLQDQQRPTAAAEQLKAVVAADDDDDDDDEDVAALTRRVLDDDDDADYEFEEDDGSLDGDAGAVAGRRTAADDDDMDDFDEDDDSEADAQQEPAAASPSRLCSSSRCRCYDDEGDENRQDFFGDEFDGGLTDAVLQTAFHSSTAKSATPSPSSATVQKQQQPEQQKQQPAQERQDQEQQQSPQEKDGVAKDAVDLFVDQLCQVTQSRQQSQDEVGSKQEKHQQAGRQGRSPLGSKKRRQLKDDDEEFQQLVHANVIKGTLKLDSSDMETVWRLLSRLTDDEVGGPTRISLSAANATKNGNRIRADVEAVVKMTTDEITAVAAPEKSPSPARARGQKRRSNQREDAVQQFVGSPKRARCTCDHAVAQAHLDYCPRLLNVHGLNHHAARERSNLLTPDNCCRGMLSPQHAHAARRAMNQCQAAPNVGQQPRNAANKDQKDGLLNDANFPSPLENVHASGPFSSRYPARFACAYFP